MEQNPHYEDGMVCLYVGKTGPTRDARLANHKPPYHQPRNVNNTGEPPPPAVCGDLDPDTN